MKEKIEQKDIKIIKKQLGRFPDNLRKIALRCPQNLPLVLKTHPYDKKSGVFPTIYWLSCPFYVKEVAYLEDKGLIQKFTQHLKTDPEFAAQMAETHQNYALQRFSMLSAREIDDIKEISADLLWVLKKSGVGGIRDKKGIKCLHTHLADYLIRGQNPVGKKIREKLPSVDKCPARCY